ncbi:unnamed protein product, partial [Nesidiocoris tenuis]
VAYDGSGGSGDGRVDSDDEGYSDADDGSGSGDGPPPPIISSKNDQLHHLQRLNIVIELEKRTLCFTHMPYSCVYNLFLTFSSNRTNSRKWRHDADIEQQGAVRHGRSGELVSCELHDAVIVGDPGNRLVALTSG